MIFNGTKLSNPLCTHMLPKYERQAILDSRVAWYPADMKKVPTWRKKKDIE